MFIGWLRPTRPLHIIAGKIQASSHTGTRLCLRVKLQGIRAYLVSIACHEISQSRKLTAKDPGSQRKECLPRYKSLSLEGASEPCRGKRPGRVVEMKLRATGEGTRIRRVRGRAVWWVSGEKESVPRDKSLSGYPLLLKCKGSMACGGWVQ